ncbi:MAG: HU family DNA-binding protein [bacterium]|nr:HU family DNA-binding protein [bacterium]
MTKNELITSIAEKTSLSKAETDRFLGAALESITEALSRGETVPLVGFGTFSPIDQPARFSKIPGTGETKEISARKIVTFKMGSNLKTDINS